MHPPPSAAEQIHHLGLRPNHIHLFVPAPLNNDGKVHILHFSEAHPSLSPTTNHQLSAMVNTRSNHPSSPTPSDGSEVYWTEVDDLDGVLLVPSETADAYGWDSDASLAPFDSANATPTLAARPSSPTASPRTKPSKGKGKKKVAPAPNDDEDPFLATDLARAKAASLGQTADTDHATGGASSSCRPEADLGSPLKRQRTNTSGDAAPTPFSASTASAAPNTTMPATVNTPSVNSSGTSTAVSTPSTTTAAPSIAQTTTANIVPTAVHTTIPATVANAVPAAAPAPMPTPAAATYAGAAAATPIAAAVPAAAVSVALQALWLTADGLPPRGSYTPNPAEGFHSIVYSPELLLQGIPPDLTRMYDEVAGPKFFIIVSGGNGAVMKTHSLIRQCLANRVNIDPTSFTLGTLPTAANSTSPALWLVTDIPPQLVQAVVDDQVISSSSITLFPIPYEMPVIGFVEVFAGFTLPYTNAGTNAACNLIRTVIAANNKITQFMQTHRDASGSQVSTEGAWTAFLASVTVRGITLLVNNTNTVAWRLHVNPPTNVRDLWGKLCRRFGKLNIMTTLYGTARLQSAFRCHICPSTDRPTPLCPLPSTPGWLSPTHATIAALEDASHAAATKAQEMMCLANFDAGPSNSRGSNGRGRGSPGPKGC
ncbi:hypothetical protein B0H17DRAFT_1144250 [Mycena rosella]|uniref:Uncharacterized protein n=1 Tax=Mycena rosella TaxID=1033263 RepID=A0AAD7CTD8_MYCRO|nr:hypothetical protein B0H17DRAFT_1144250 [Mycena rosella]